MGAQACSLDLWQSTPAPRRARGQMAYLAGLAAEAVVERAYLAQGVELLKRRWRGKAGEIDLIFVDRQNGEEALIFAEVKTARTHAKAAHALRPAQARRLCMAGQEFAGQRPSGQLTPMRFDLAMVDGQGQVELLENAIGEF